MKHKMYTIHDRKAGAFLPPFIMPVEAMALRAFGDCVNDSNHAFNRHPEDYTLFRIADFDDQTGMFELESAPVSVGNGLTFVEVDRDG